MKHIRILATTHAAAKHHATQHGLKPTPHTKIHLIHDTTSLERAILGHQTPILIHQVTDLPDNPDFRAYLRALTNGNRIHITTDPPRLD